VNALILAAGQGRRLWPYTSERPKCLLSLGTQTILEHQLERLARAGVDRVTVIAGFGLEAVRRKVSCAPQGLVVRVLYNPFYAAADNLISLWAARSEMDDDFLLLNGDNAFHPHILRLLQERDGVPCQLLVQRKADYTEDDMKVHVHGSRLRRVGKGLPLEQVDAASIGIMRFTGPGATQLRRVLEEAVQSEGALRTYYLDCLQRLADAGVPLDCVDVGQLPWADIDTPADLHAVRDSFLAFEETCAAPVDVLTGRA
jgi:choline kinase